MTASRPLDPNEWQRINALFHDALDRAPEDRAAFLATACDDPVLRDEVHSLLTAHERGAAILDSGGAGTTLARLAAPDVDALVGQQLGHYRIERVLGEGGMGVVYMAEDLNLGRTVALKSVAAKFTGDGTRRDRLRREARAAAALTHPGIATVYALEEIDGHVFIAGEYVPGHTLRDEISRGPVAPWRAVETTLEIARALAAAHDRGVIHRDLKPENVIRTPGGHVKILDFGLARFRDVPAALANLTDDGSVLGTPAYMSPEQIRGGSVDERSDLFALGVLFYELVSGRHPLAGSDPASTIVRILEGEPAPLRSIGSGHDPVAVGALEEVILTCLRKLPEERFRSVHEFIAALERMHPGAAGGSDRVVLPPRSGPAAMRPSGAVWWWQFHQAATSLVYIATLLPLWIARTPLTAVSRRAGAFIFLAALLAVLVSVTLRLHLWFTLRSYPADLPAQAQRLRRWIRGADGLLVLTLGVTGILLASAGRDALASGFIALGVAILLSFSIIEPATTKAAFEDRL